MMDICDECGMPEDHPYHEDDHDFVSLDSRLAVHRQIMDDILENSRDS